MSRLPPSWLTSERPVPRRLVRPLREYLATETAGAVVLLVAAGIALVWVNSPLRDSYTELWSTKLTINLGDASVEDTLRGWVDGLMTLFFFVVGLEIKRELTVGELRDPRRASAPVIGALGGMIVPAAIYIAFTAGTEGATGWGIPMATDIAFALGVLALLGPRAPSSLRVFLLSLAIVDDIGAILVIALFYSESVALGWLAAAVGLFGVMILMRFVGIRYVPAYVLVGTATWFATLHSGVHATIAGVAIALLTPARPLKIDEEGIGDFDASASAGETRQQILNLRETVSPAERLAHFLHPWTSFVVLPLFALANAGVGLSADDLTSAASSRVTLGVVLGLVVGKMVGISASVWLAQKMGVASLPDDVTRRQLLAVSSVAGIGFTVSLFITSLAFSDPDLVADAKVGILAGSVVAALIAYLILRSGPAPSNASARDN